MFNSYSYFILVNEAVIFSKKYELSLGCLPSGHRNLSMYQASSSTVFFFVSYMHIHVPFIMYCSRLFSKKRILLLKHDDVRQVTELHLSTKFHDC